MDISEVWAKTSPAQSLMTHGIISGIVAQKLTEKFLSSGTKEQLARGLNLSPDDLEPFAGYFVSLHDIGKIHYSFQAKAPDMLLKLRETAPERICLQDLDFRHEVETGKALKRIWSGCDRRTSCRLAEILAAHHQGKKQNLSQQTAQGAWEEMQVQFERKMHDIFLKEHPFPRLEKNQDSVICAVLLGIVILSDWIASSESFTEAENWKNLRESASTKAEMFLEESGLVQKSHDYGSSFCETWPNIPETGKRELQAQTEVLFREGMPRCSLILMEAPMGEGKTEAGIYAALQMARQWGKNGFYVALPTSATANQMVGRVRKLLSMHDQGEEVKLLHAMAWMVDEQSEKYQDFFTEEDAFARNWLQPMRRGLLSSCAVGTVDQAMMAAMFLKYGVLRLLGLSGKALIIDEIHAYDTYMQSILTRLLEWCKALEVPVVLLSATLPPDKKQQLLGIYSQESMDNPYPAITAVHEDGTLQILPFDRVAKRQIYRISLQPMLYEPEKIAKAAITTVCNGGCLCILLNTVKQAQEVYTEIREKDFTGELLLFHSRFLAERREKIEKKCLKLFGKEKKNRPGKAILVATQVVEQSLDVDFDFFMSAIAPIDLLIQRLGRQFRHEDTPRPTEVTAPEFVILTPGDSGFGSDRYIYPQCLLQQTIHLLETRQEIRVPEDIAQLVADGYDTRKVPPEELENWMENLIDESMKGAAADKYKLWSPNKKFRPLAEAVEFDDLEQQSYLSAQTRLSEPTVRMALLEQTEYEQLCPLVQDGRLPIRDRSMARRIMASSVSIQKKKFDSLCQKYGLLDITGDRLITGIRILSKDNPCFRDDPELGVIWKEKMA